MAALFASFFSRCLAAFAALFSAFFADLSSLEPRVPPVNKSSSNCFFAIFSSYLIHNYKIIQMLFYTILTNITSPNFTFIA